MFIYLKLSLPSICRWLIANKDQSNKNMYEIITNQYNKSIDLIIDEWILGICSKATRYLDNKAIYLHFIKVQYNHWQISPLNAGVALI